MLISTKTIGSKKPLFEDFSITMPPGWSSDDHGDGGITLRDVIERIVLHEVNAFRQRQTDRQFIRALTANEIESGVESGKIEMGGSEIGKQNLNDDDAIGSALIAFEDGLYLVVIDDVQFTSLDQAVFLRLDSRLTFVKLTMLSGG